MKKTNSRNRAVSGQNYHLLLLITKRFKPLNYSQKLHDGQISTTLLEIKSKNPTWHQAMSDFIS